MSATDQATADDAMVRGEATPEEQAETAAARSSQELAERSDFTLPARHAWDSSQKAVIQQTVAKDCKPAELAMFLEVASRYKLDPFIREIFAAKFNGSNGPVTIFAGRDGMLKAAKNTGKFRKMESAVVREKDEYEVVVDTETIDGDTGGRVRKLKHVRKGMGTEARGEIVGAYALVWLQGEDEPWFAEATWEDYGKAKSGTDKSNWKVDGSGYPEAMMVKVPQAIALRMACGLAGIYAQEEVQKQIDAKYVQNLSSGGGDGATPQTPGVKWPEGEAGAVLEALVERANELVPGSWRAAKVAVRVNGKSEADHSKLEQELKRFIAQRKPDDPLVIADAVVVDEPKAEPEQEPEPQATDQIMQGPVSEPVIAAMHDNEAARTLVQERLEQVRAIMQTDPELAVGQLGFESNDELDAELERLEAALRDATNGGPTVAEEAEAEVVDAEVVPEDEPEEPIEWGELAEAELADLEDVLPTLQGELESAEEGTEAHRVLQNNYDEALARRDALLKARDEQSGVE